MGYKIVTDSCAGLPDYMYDGLGVEVIGMEFIEGDKVYTGYVKGRDNSLQECYALMRQGKVFRTTCINQAAYYDFFEKQLAEGDILYLGFSSGLSASFSNSMFAIDELREKYSERKIFAVDTLGGCMGQGLLVYHAAMLKNQGKSIEEVRDWAEQNKRRLCHWFTVEDLKYLYRGGRVSRINFILGKIAQIKPIIRADDEGRLAPASKVIGRRKSISALAKKVHELIENPEEQTVFVAHGDCLEDAEELAAQVTKNIKVKSVVINQIDPVMGCHSGPGALAVFFLGRHR